MNARLNDEVGQGLRRNDDAMKTNAGIQITQTRPKNA